MCVCTYVCMYVNIYCTYACMLWTRQNFLCEYTYMCVYGERERERERERKREKEKEFVCVGVDDGRKTSKIKDL